MAEVSGGAAYKGYQKIDNGISQGLQHWGGIKAKENAAKKLADERAGVRKEESESKYAKQFDESWEYEMTGNNDYDSIQTSFVGKVIEKAKVHGRLAKEAFNKGNRKEAEYHENIYRNSRDSFKTFKTMTPIIQERLKYYAENKDNFLSTDRRGDISIAMMKNNFLVEPDKNGKPKMIVGVDKDKDGIISEEEKEAGKKYIRDGFKTKGFEFVEINPSDFGRGAYDSYRKVPILEKNGIIDDLTSSVGITTIDTSTGNYITTTTSLTPDKYEQLRKNAELKMADKEVQANVMSKLGFLNEEGFIKDKYSSDEIKKGVDYLVEASKKKFGFKETKKFNIGKVSTDISKARLKETKRANKERESISRGKGSGSKSIITTDDITLDNGKKAKVFSTDKGFSLETKFISDLVKSGLEKPSIIKEKYNTAIVDEDGKVYLSSGKDKIELNDSQQTYIANQLGLKTGKELREYVGIKDEIKTDTSKMTPQQKIDYYKNLNTNK